jgi:hypothetical protein
VREQLGKLVAIVIIIGLFAAAAWIKSGGREDE